MRTIVPVDRTMQLPLNLAEGLRMTFADVGLSPLPERLAALVRQSGADQETSANEGSCNGREAEVRRTSR